MPCTRQSGDTILWDPQYRCKVLTAAIACATKALIAAACARSGLVPIAVETEVDHVHVFVSAPPRWSPAQIANLLKGYTSRSLRERFPRLKRICGRDPLWTQSYDVGTAGPVAAETIRRYIEECQGK